MAYVLGSGLGLASLSSIAFVTFTYMPYMLNSMKTSGFLHSKTGAQSLFNYQDAHTAMIQAAARCDISVDGNNAGLVVDDVTYFAFMRSYRPQQQLGLVFLEDPRAYLEQVGSAGAVLTHHRVPPQLASEAICTGQFCCLRAF